MVEGGGCTYCCDCCWDICANDEFIGAAADFLENAGAVINVGAGLVELLLSPPVFDSFGCSDFVTEGFVDCFIA